MSILSNSSKMYRLRYLPALALVSLGVMGMLNLTFSPNQYLLGIFATSPLINLGMVGAGIALAAKQWGRAILPSDKLFNYLMQALAALLAILAIGGFISIALRWDSWLTIMPNTLYSDILWAILAIYWLYQAWWLQPQQ